MSSTQHLALDVGSFKLLGSYDEAVWGDPKDIESHQDIQEWVKGLREDGGGGCVSQPVRLIPMPNVLRHRLLVTC